MTTLHWLVWILLALYIGTALVGASEGLKPRGSAGYKMLQFFLETTVIVLVVYVLAC